MPANRCVVFGCNNFANKSNGISLHYSPKNKQDGDKWKRFVRLHRANFNPPGRFVVCSLHFEEKVFARALHIEGMQRSLLPRATPTIWLSEQQQETSVSDRSRRHALKNILQPAKNVEEEAEQMAANSHLEVDEVEDRNDQESPQNEQQQNLGLDCENNTRIESTHEEELLVPSTTSKSTSCEECVYLQTEVLQLKADLKSMKTQVKKLERTESQLLAALEQATKKSTVFSQGCQTDNYNHEPESDDEEMDIEEEDICDPEWQEKVQREVDKVFNQDNEVAMEEEPLIANDGKYNELGEDNPEYSNPESDNLDPRLTTEGKDCREQPKCIVFLSNLLLLFQFCHLCCHPKPSISTKQTGTMITVTTLCSKCKKTSTWLSQPLILGKFPAVNILLSFGILTAGASIRKVLLVLRHINVMVYNETTYYYHQRHLLIPAIVSFWRQYQQGLIDKLNGVEVDLAGDARHDSMGHSAKYGTYTIFCCTLGLIINIVLIQANEAGSSSQMEFLGHQRSIMYLLTTGMLIKQFISDRHTSITKWMKEECPKLCKDNGKPTICHYFDLWHIAKKIQKIITKLAKEKSCEVIGRWRKACVRHFYWAVMSTPAHLGAVKLAKFQAFLYHIINKHTGLPNQLFNKCTHGILATPRVWLTKSSEAYEKIFEKLTKVSLSKAIKNASPIAQTSSLEGFHSVVNQFAPKMLSFSYLGMFSRTILAALHFNYNCDRESKIDDHGDKKLKVVYAKYKNGEGTVREVRVPQNYDYVDDIFKCLVETPRADLKQLRIELEESVPEPMHSMLEKETKEEAINKHQNRKGKETQLVPPTCTEEQLQNLTQERNAARNDRRAPHCRKCGQPMKGHDKEECNRLYNQ